MGLMLKRQRDGTLRPWWYAVYIQSDGTRKVENSNLKWRGNPPASLNVGDSGDDDFEASRKEAETWLANRAEEHRHKGRAEHLTERLIESKTGRRVKYVKIADLPQCWRALGRQSPAHERHLATCAARFDTFAKHMRTRNPSAVYLYEVSPEDAATFVDGLQKPFAPSTAKAIVRLLNRAFVRFLPVGADNPFSAFSGSRGKGETETIHRRPFRPDELRALLDIAQTDEFMNPLIVTAALTGMRRGDVCRLRWRDVDLAGGMITVKTAKTGAQAEVPIFPPLRAVLAARLDNGSPFVFPAAAAMLAKNAQGLSYRFKVLVAKALSSATPAKLPPPTPAAEIETVGTAAIFERLPEGERRSRILDTFRRYCAGESVRQIEKAIHRPRSTISYDLHAVEDMISTPFMRSAQTLGMKAQIARITRSPREHGQRAASVMDWHGLRATWVTLALTAGVPMDLVRRVTGHATVDIVLRHYFRPGRADFKTALANALPDVLTGGKPAKVSPADELVILATKVAEKSATKGDKERLRKLAAKV